MDLPIIIACVACIAVGVGVIAYVLFRTPKQPASFGDRPEISLGEVEAPTENEETEENENEKEDGEQ